MWKILAKNLILFLLLVLGQAVLRTNLAEIEIFCRKGLLEIYVKTIIPCQETTFLRLVKTHFGGSTRQDLTNELIFIAVSHFPWSPACRQYKE